MISSPWQPILSRSSRVLGLSFARRSSISRIEHRLDGCSRGRRAETMPLVFSVFCGDGSVGLLHLFVVISFDYVTHNWTGRFAAVTAGLYQHGNYNFRRAPRRVPHKPGIILELLALTEPAA